MRKICIVCMIIMFVLTINFAVYALDPAITAQQIGTGDTDSDIAKAGRGLAQTVLGIVSVISSAVAVGMLIFYGIKYMTSGAADKAKVKDTLLPYLIGAILVAGATTIAKYALSISV